LLTELPLFYTVYPRSVRNVGPFSHSAISLLLVQNRVLFSWFFWFHTRFYWRLFFTIIYQLCKTLDPGILLAFLFLLCRKYPLSSIMFPLEM